MPVDKISVYDIIKNRKENLVAKTRRIPWSVREAQKAQNKDTLRSLALYGNMVKRELAAFKKNRRINMMLAGAKEMAHQANEHICPID